MASKVFLRLCVLLAFAVGGTGLARAQSFDFSYSYSGVSVLGVFNTTGQGNGRYLINSITGGKRNGSEISLLAPGSLNTNNNVLYFPPSGGGYLNLYGFAFGTPGGEQYNPYYDGGYREATPSNFSGTPITSFTVTARVSPAPVPGGGLLSFLTLAIAGIAYRRKRACRRARLMARSYAAKRPRSARRHSKACAVKLSAKVTVAFSIAAHARATLSTLDIFPDRNERAVHTSGCSVYVVLA